jgi:hypothetical protein
MQQDAVKEIAQGFLLERLFLSQILAITPD